MNNEKSTTIVFRYIVPVLITLNLFIVSGISMQVNAIDNKLFKHLTNDEIHTPRSSVMTKNEFFIYQEFYRLSTEDIKKSICDLQEDVKFYFNK